MHLEPFLRINNSSCSLNYKRSTISQYLIKAKSIVDELAAAGHPLSPAKFNAIIFRNLRQEFQSVVTNLNMRPELVPFVELHS